VALQAPLRLDQLCHDRHTFCGVLKQLEDAGLLVETMTANGRAVRWLGAQPKDSLPS
jgi:hypothetical protein